MLLIRSSQKHRARAARREATKTAHPHSCTRSWASEARKREGRGLLGRALRQLDHYARLLGNQAASAGALVLGAKGIGLVLRTGRDADAVVGTLAGDLRLADVDAAAADDASELARKAVVGLLRLGFRRQR